VFWVCVLHMLPNGKETIGRTTSSGPNKHDLVVYFLVLKCDHVLRSVGYGISVEVTNRLWDFVLVLTCTRSW
jgi:hypothetical protein